MNGQSINVAIVGTGWYGSGVVSELLRHKETHPKVLVNRNINKAIESYTRAGVHKDNIRVFQTCQDLIEGDFIVSDSMMVIRYFEDIDIVFECTGDILAGTETCLECINKKIPFVTANSEMDATVGVELCDLARKNNTIYSNSDGDQPGVLARLIREMELYGFQVKVVGNSKEFLDVYQNPKGVVAYVPQGQNINKTCSFADGTKQAFELCVVSNAFGYYCFQRGMTGPITTKENLVNSFLNIITPNVETTYIDYVMGIQGIDSAGVFGIGYRDDRRSGPDLKHLKRGPGPYYLFYRDYHLCYYETIQTILDVYRKSQTFLTPKGKYSEVVALAKRDLIKGKKMDGIGGFDCYGVIEKSFNADRQNLLPIGISEYCHTKENIPKDTPITYDMVHVETNIVTTLLS